MDAKLIEKLDRQRYWAVVLQAVALIDIFVETSLYYILHWSPAHPIFNISDLVGLPLLLVAGVWYLVIEERIRHSKELHAALHNEMYIVYKHRSQRIAFWVVMLTPSYALFDRLSPMEIVLFHQIIFQLGFFVPLI